MRSPPPTAAGIEVIVTDHHEPGDRAARLPVLHPRLSGYPCGELCATGVAYKLSAALLGPDEAERELDLVALATVADLVPLRGENRALVRAGACRRPKGGAARAAGPVRAPPWSPCASTRATSPSGSGRGSMPPVGSTAPTPASS